MRNSTNKILAWILSMILIWNICLPCVPALAEGTSSAVTFAVERFTLGQGYLISPERVSISSGESAASVAVRMLSAAGYAPVYSGSVTGSFYLSSVKNADSGVLHIPSALSAMSPDAPSNTKNNGNSNYPDLGQFSYSSYAGWLYTVNGVFPNVPMSDYILQNGDVLRLQFSLYGSGADLGSSQSGVAALAVAQKDLLTDTVAGYHADLQAWKTIAGFPQAYEDALNVLENLTASQAEIDAAYAGLPKAAQSLSIEPNTLEIRKDADSYGLSSVITAPEGAVISLTWSSMDPQVATVDDNGLVTPLAAGETDIRVATTSQPYPLEAVCHVRVIEIPITSLELSSTELSLEYGSMENTSLTAAIYPEDTTDSRLLNWTTDSSGIVSFTKTDGGILLTPENIGTARITVTTVNGVTAACTVRVVNSEEMVRQLVSRIMKLPGPKEITLEDDQQIKNVMREYERLSQTGKELMTTSYPAELSKLMTCSENMENLWKDKRQEILTCAQNVLKEDHLYYPSDLLSGYFQAYNFYEKDMPVEEQEMFSPEQSEILDHAKNRVKGFLNESNGITVDTDWYIRTVTTEGTEIQKKTALTFIRDKNHTAEGKILLMKQLAFENVLDASVYIPSGKQHVTIQAPKGYSSAQNPVVYLGKASGDSVSGLMKMSVIYSKDTDLITLTGEIPENACIVLADVPVPITGMSISPSLVVLDKGEKKQLKIQVKPVNTTQSDKVTWTSSDKKAVSVSSAGKVKGIAEGTATITATLKANTKVKASVKVTVRTTSKKLSPSLSVMRKNTKNYILSVDTNPDLTSQWNVLGLARSGLKVSEDYYDTFYKNAVNELTTKDGRLTGTTYTEYSKLILTMTAIGKDARNIGGYNLFASLADFDQVKKQGINGPVWALIAVNCHPDYKFVKSEAVNNLTTEKKIIRYILEREISGGGWNLSSDVADVDVTAMVLQAFAPYYNQKGYSDVTKAVNRGLSWLGSQQNPSTGGFSSGGSENCESTCQVIVALTSLDIDPNTDIRFVKRGNWLLSNLTEYYVEGGGFSHTSGGNRNGMGTEQGCYAMSSYYRYTKGKTALYDMSDLAVKKGSKGQVTDKGKTSGTGNLAGSSQTKRLNSGASPTRSSQRMQALNKTVTQSSGSSGAAKISAEASSEEETASGWSFDGESYQDSESWSADTLDEYKQKDESEENVEDVQKDTGASEPTAAGNRRLEYTVAGFSALIAVAAGIFWIRKRKTSVKGGDWNENKEKHQ